MASRRRRSLTNRGARGPSPARYDDDTAVLGVRLPEQTRRLLDHVALTIGDPIVSPSMLGRIGVEHLLATMGFETQETARGQAARARIAAWLVDPDRVTPDGAEPAGGTSPAPS